MDYPWIVCIYSLAVFVVLAMSVCQLATGNVFADNDNVDGGDGAAHEFSQKQGPQQNRLCVSAGKSTLLCNNLSGQTHTSTGGNAAEQQDNDSGLQF